MVQRIEYRVSAPLMEVRFLLRSLRIEPWFDYLNLFSKNYFLIFVLGTCYEFCKNFDKTFKYLKSSLKSNQLVSNMGEIKIVVSDETEKLIEKLADQLGIKKTEYVKGLVIDDLKELNCGKQR